MASSTLRSCLVLGNQSDLKDVAIDDEDKVSMPATVANTMLTQKPNQSIIMEWNAMCEYINATDDAIYAVSTHGDCLVLAALASLMSSKPAPTFMESLPERYRVFDNAHPCAQQVRLDAVDLLLQSSACLDAADKLVVDDPAWEEFRKEGMTLLQKMPGMSDAQKLAKITRAFTLREVRRWKSPTFWVSVITPVFIAALEQVLRARIFIAKTLRMNEVRLVESASIPEFSSAREGFFPIRILSLPDGIHYEGVAGKSATRKGSNGWMRFFLAPPKQPRSALKQPASRLENIVTPLSLEEMGVYAKVPGQVGDDVRMMAPQFKPAEVQQMQAPRRQPPQYGVVPGFNPAAVQVAADGTRVVPIPTFSGQLLPVQVTPKTPQPLQGAAPRHLDVHVVMDCAPSIVPVEGPAVSTPQVSFVPVEDPVVGPSKPPQTFAPVEQGPRVATLAQDSPVSPGTPPPQLQHSRGSGTTNISLQRFYETPVPFVKPRAEPSYGKKGPTAPPHPVRAVSGDTPAVRAEPLYGKGGPTPPAYAFEVVGSGMPPPGQVGPTRPLVKTGGRHAVCSNEPTQSNDATTTHPAFFASMGGLARKSDSPREATRADRATVFGKPKILSPRFILALERVSSFVDPENFADESGQRALHHAAWMLLTLQALVTLVTHVVQNWPKDTVVANGAEFFTTEKLLGLMSPAGADTFWETALQKKLGVATTPKQLHCEAASMLRITTAIAAKILQYALHKDKDAMGNHPQLWQSLIEYMDAVTGEPFHSQVQTEPGPWPHQIPNGTLPPPEEEIVRGAVPPAAAANFLVHFSGRLADLVPESRAAFEQVFQRSATDKDAKKVFLALVAAGDGSYRDALYGAGPGFTHKGFVVESTLIQKAADALAKYRAFIEPETDPDMEDCA